MNSIVYEAYERYLTYKRNLNDEEYLKRKASEPPRPKGNLWPTDVGKCHRAALLRVNRYPGEFDPGVRGLDYMNTGTITEEETRNALQYVFGERLETQVALKWKMWSGKPDFGIDIGTTNPLIIEHKATSEKHFDTDSTTELPKHEHLGQAMTYMFLYEKMYRITPEIRLFYKAWGNFAEFQINREDDHIMITSYVNGVINLRKYEYDAYAEIEELMMWYNNTELPPRLDKKYKGCTFMGQPSCQFYNQCWDD